jgi:methylmalonyl-CoA mutase N-terminal domain/subunit
VRPAPQRIDPAAEADQVARLHAYRDARDPGQVAAALDGLSRAAHGSDNVVPRIRGCVEAHATLGEIAATLRAEWGEHRE